MSEVPLYWQPHAVVTLDPFRQVAGFEVLGLDRSGFRGR